MKEASVKLLQKAAQSIRAAELLLKSGEIEFVASRVYYAMFYVAEALLNEKGLRFRKHGGVHGAFGEHFAKSGEFDPKFHRWLLEAFNARITDDYGIESSISREEVAAMIAHAREFLAEAHRYLKSTGSGGGHTAL